MLLLSGHRLLSVASLDEGVYTTQHRHVTPQLVHGVCQPCCAHTFGMLQAAVQPPTFVLFVNDVKLIEEEYKRYLTKQLRANINFSGTPLRLLFRGKPARDRPSRPNYDDD